MGLFEDLAVIGFDAANKASGGHHREAAKNAAEVLAELYMNERNMLPRDAQAKAAGMVTAAREQAKAAGTDTIDPLGDRMLRTEEAYCRALMESEHVHVSEIKEWWDEVGFMRYVYMNIGHEEWHRAKDLFASMGADEATASACAWRVAPIFDQRHPGPGEDPNFTPLPGELWYRVRQTSLEPPWMDDLDPIGLITSVSGGEQTPTYNAWLRGQLAFGRVPLPSFQH
jgi:hypothetical protein